MSIRIVIALDVEAESLDEAYLRVYRNMATVDTNNFSWESTDEWFDDNGEQVDEDVVQETRLRVFSALPDMGPENKA